MSVLEDGLWQDVGVTRDCSCRQTGKSESVGGRVFPNSANDASVRRVSIGDECLPHIRLDGSSLNECCYDLWSVCTLAA